MFSKVEITKEMWMHWKSQDPEACCPKGCKSAQSLPCVLSTDRMTATNRRERGSQWLGANASDSSEFLCIHNSAYLCVLEADVCLSLGIEPTPEHEVHTLLVPG